MRINRNVKSIKTASDHFSKHHYPFKTQYDLFPDVSVSKFMEIAQEIYNKANSDIETIKDFYDTSYADYSFEIKFVDLYEIYLKHQ